MKFDRAELTETLLRGPPRWVFQLQFERFGIEGLKTFSEIAFRVIYPLFMLIFMMSLVPPREKWLKSCAYA